MLNKTKIKKLIVEFPRYRNIDAFLVTNDTNTRYLTDFPACESWLLVTLKKSYYITDSRYTLEARQGLKGVTVKQFTTTPCATLFELCKTLKIKRLGFDERHSSVLFLKKLKGFCPTRTKLIPATGIVEELREIKEPQEIETTRQCLKLHVKALRFMHKVVKKGVSERSIALKLEQFVKSHGAEFSFPPIIASGPNSCFPHAKVSDRILKDNEPVLLDFGIQINGYKSDLTRNFFLGRMTAHYAQVLEALRLAQAQAIQMIKPGVAVADVDAQARKVLRKFKLAKYFGHSLGHGVGLDIHENPRLSVKSQAILQPGMIVTVEPGVYIPHQFGIRVEDMVLVTEQGCEVLSGHID